MLTNVSLRVCCKRFPQASKLALISHMAIALPFGRPGLGRLAVKLLQKRVVYGTTALPQLHGDAGTSMQSQHFHYAQNVDIRLLSPQGMQTG